MQFGLDIKPNLTKPIPNWSQVFQKPTETELK